MAEQTWPRLQHTVGIGFAVMVEERAEVIPEIHEFAMWRVVVGHYKMFTKPATHVWFIYYIQITMRLSNSPEHLSIRVLYRTSRAMSSSQMEGLFRFFLGASPFRVHTDTHAYFSGSVPSDFKNTTWSRKSFPFFPSPRHNLTGQQSPPRFSCYSYPSHLKV